MDQPKASREYIWIIVSSLIIIATVALGFILYFARSVLIPFVLAVFIVSIVSPILDFQVLKLKLPRSLAVSISLLIVVIVIIVLFFLIFAAIQTIVSTAARYSESFVDLVGAAFTELDNLGFRLDREDVLADMRNRIARFLPNTFGTVLGFISRFTLMAIFVIFLLSGRNPKVIRKGVYADIDRDVRRYIATKVAVSSTTGLFVWIALSIMKLELAGVFGILAFLLNFIPSIGSIIATLLPIPIAVAQFSSPITIAMVILIPGSIQMTIGNFVEPKIMGHGLNLHPVIVLLSLAFWGILWGIPGMFLAVPVTAVIRIVLLQFDTLKPIALALSGQLPESK